MRIKELWIQNYKKYNDRNIIFENNNDNSALQKNIFGKMNIVLFSGENGSGKTTILSFVSYIFRFLQRFRERLESDYRLSYEIQINRMLHNIILYKKDKNIFISVDGEWRYIQEFRKGHDKGYRINPDIPEEKQVTYDEIKKYLPSCVFVIGFDKAYRKLSYGSNYIGDNLVDYRDLSSDYSTTSRGNYNSKGIAYLYYIFSTNSQLRKMFTLWGLELSNFVDICPNVEDLESLQIRLKREYPRYYKESYKWDQPYIDGQKKYFESGIESYLVDIDSEYNKRFMIVDYLKNKKNYQDLLHLIVNGIIYINEFYIRKENKDIPIIDMSTGEKAFLFDLFAVCSNIENNALIIWEEPETHLNMKWSQNLVPLLVQLFNKSDVQWLFSSHSAYMIKNLFQNQIIRLKGLEINTPDFNTFLANDTEIYKRLFEDNEANPFEKAVLKEIEKGNHNEQQKIMSVLGESYIKFLLYKSWEN